MRSQVANADEQGEWGGGLTGWKMWCDWSTVSQMGRRLEVGGEEVEDNVELAPTVK